MKVNMLLSKYMHHAWIGAFMIVGAAALHARFTCILPNHAFHLHKRNILAELSIGLEKEFINCTPVSNMAADNHEDS